MDDLLAVGWEPFAVVSEPVASGEEIVYGQRRQIIVGHVNMIWFRRVLA